MRDGVRSKPESCADSQSPELNATAVDKSGSRTSHLFFILSESQSLPHAALSNKHKSGSSDQFASSIGAAANGKWDAAGREMLLKASSRQRFTETSGLKICSFLADAELFVTLCDRPCDRWGFFVLSWLGSEEAKKVRRSHVVDSFAKYDTFRDGLIALFGRFEFEASYRASRRNLRQAGAESIAAYAARTTDMCSRAFTNFSTEDQLSLVVDHFIAGLADQSSRTYLQRERAQRALEWLEAVRIAQTSEAARLSDYVVTAAAVASETNNTLTSAAAREQSNSGK